MRSRNGSSAGTRYVYLRRAFTRRNALRLHTVHRGHRRRQHIGVCACGGVVAVVAVVSWCEGADATLAATLATTLALPLASVSFRLRIIIAQVCIF